MYLPLSSIIASSVSGEEISVLELSIPKVSSPIAERIGDKDVKRVTNTRSEQINLTAPKQASVVVTSDIRAHTAETVIREYTASVISNTKRNR